MIAGYLVFARKIVSDCSGIQNSESCEVAVLKVAFDVPGERRVHLKVSLSTFSRRGRRLPPVLRSLA